MRARSRNGWMRDGCCVCVWNEWQKIKIKKLNKKNSVGRSLIWNGYGSWRRKKPKKK